MKHFLSIHDFGKERIHMLLTDAEYFSNNVDSCSSILNSKLLVNAFFEPSLRTQLSFEAAIVRLDGNVLGMGSKNSTRANSAHEESPADSARMMSGYADVIVFRHSSPVALRLYAEGCSAQHPAY